MVVRVRGSRGPSKSPELSILDEVFTSQNWLVRIYQVKKEDALGRSLSAAQAFDQGQPLRSAPFPIHADAIVP